MTMYDDSRVVTLLREIDPPVAPPDRLGEVTRRARRHESRRASALAGVMAAVLAAGVVSAINLGDRGHTEVLTVAGAANATTAAGSARFSMEMVLTKSVVPSVPAGQLMKLSGPVKFDGSRFRLVGSFMRERFEVRGIGKDRWTMSGLGASFTPVSQKPWTHSVEQKTANSGGLPDISSADPTELLDLLKLKGTTISQVQIGDRTKTVLRLPADIFGTFGSARGSVVDVTVESDGRDRIRVMTSDVTIAGTGTMTSTMRYDDFGIDVDVRPPPADQVQEEADVRSGSGVVQSIPLNSSSSPEQRKEACAMFRRIREQRPAPQTEQEKAQRKLLDSSIAELCAKKP